MSPVMFSKPAARAAAKACRAGCAGWGRQFTSGQLAYIRQLAAHGYARCDGRTLALTPSGLLVQNTILAELL